MTQEKITRIRQMEKCGSQKWCGMGWGKGWLEREEWRKKNTENISETIFLYSLLSLLKNLKILSATTLLLGFVLFVFLSTLLSVLLFCILVLQGEFCLTRHQGNCQLCQSAVITRARDQKEQHKPKRKKKKKRKRWGCSVGVCCRVGGRGSLQCWENTFYPFLPSHFSYTLFFFSSVGNSKGSAYQWFHWARILKVESGHPVPSSETLTSIELTLKI